MDYFLPHRREKNASKTAKHFGISRKTFHKWKKRFEKKHCIGLEELSRTPQLSDKKTKAIVKKPKDNKELQGESKRSKKLLPEK